MVANDVDPINHDERSGQGTKSGITSEYEGNGEAGQHPMGQRLPEEAHPSKHYPRSHRGGSQHS